LKGCDKVAHLKRKKNAANSRTRSREGYCEGGTRTRKAVGSDLR